MVRSAPSGFWAIPCSALGITSHRLDPAVDLLMRLENPLATLVAGVTGGSHIQGVQVFVDQTSSTNNGIWDKPNDTPPFHVQTPQQSLHNLHQNILISH